MKSGRKVLVEEVRALTCRWPNKRVYDTRQEAEDSLLFLSTGLDFKAGQGENVFSCPAGHFHVGRKGHTRARGRRRR